MTSAARPTRRFPFPALVAALTLGGTVCGGNGLPPDDPSSPPPEGGLQLADLEEGQVTTVATGLRIPWDVRFLPGGGLLVTERPGRLVELAPDGSVRRGADVPGVVHTGEGGLMGLALSPEFEQTRRVYLCLTTRVDGSLANRVIRYRWVDGRLSDASPVLAGMEAGPVHDGCRLEFGPDGLLYATMGDAGDGDLAQDRGSLNGKILRVAPDGSVPSDNPFGTPVYSWGHRNPQGMAWDDGGRLWATEHGPSGFRSGRDELNRIRAGANYGWPRVTGDETGADLTAPVLHSGDDTWAPGDVAHREGSLFWGGLRGSSLYQARLPGDGGEQLELIRHFRGDFGRIRVVRVGPDGNLWLATSNRDGRGDPREGDDRIVRVDGSVF